MTFLEMKTLAQEGSLFVEKSAGNTFTRRIIRYAKKMPSLKANPSAEAFEKYQKEWLEYEKDPESYDVVLETKYVKYKKHYYFARTNQMPEYENYKITKSKYLELLREGASLYERK